MSLFTARESNQFNSFLSSLEVEEAGPLPPSQWPGGGGGSDTHQGFTESRGAGSDQSSYSYRIPLSPSQYTHQQSQPSYPSSSSFPSNSHPQKRRISGSATASSSSPSSSVPWPQPEIGLVHVPPSPTRRSSQHSMAAPRIERRGSAEWTVPIYRSLPSQRDGFDSEREGGARGRPPPSSNGTMGLVDHPARPRQSLPPPRGSSPGGSSSSSYPPQHLGPPRLPNLLPPPTGSSSRSLSPSKPQLQQQNQPPPPHPHAQRPSNSYRSHPIPVPSSSSSTSTTTSFVQPTPNSVFSAPPMPPLRARSPVIPALLTASQKKANHIASEQKRRANIRRGYDALCNEIPSLREASRLEALKTSGAAGGGGAGGTGRRGSRARKSKVEGTAEPDQKAEKVDGRSGPKSEGIVLVKTIEHLRDLLGQRLGLLSRLDQLRSQVKASYPREEHSRLGLEGGGPWEMEWEGGMEEDQGSEEEGEE